MHFSLLPLFAFRKEGIRAWHAPVISARILRWWMSVREKIETPTVHIRDRDTDGSGMHYLCFRRSRKFAETGRSRYIFGTIQEWSLLLSLSFTRSLFPASGLRFSARSAVPQVVGLVRVIQGISAETDVGVDRRVSFSHPSRGPTICHSSAPSFSISTPDVSQNTADRYDRAW